MKVQIVPLSQLHTCMHIRHEVFVVGQRVPFDEEMDHHDVTDCTHFLATLDGRPVGAARLRFTEAGQGKAERVAVLAEARGEGVGAALMAALHDEAARRGAAEVILASQVQALPFYEKLGYTAYGELFLDAGIDHYMARKALEDQSS